MDRTAACKKEMSRKLLMSKGIIASLNTLLRRNTLWSAPFSHSDASPERKQPLNILMRLFRGGEVWYSVHTPDKGSVVVSLA
jgi:hypothetical protein